MQTVWITGAHGFIGRHLALRLAGRGWVVAGIGHGAWPAGDAAANGVRYWLNGEIHPSNLRQLSREAGRPELIYHLAGGASVGAAITAPREDFMRTVATTAELLDWVRLESATTRVIVVSSAAVYGAARCGPIDESATPSPMSPYGFHKLMMEQLCRSYALTYGIVAAVVRLFSVYGSGLKKQLLWDLCTKLAAAKGPVKLGGTGAELRDWTDIRDVVRALEMASALATTDVPVINAGTGVATPVRDIASTLTDLWPDPCSVEFSGDIRAGDPFSLVSDGSRLSERGFLWEVPLDVGLRDYVNWFLSLMGRTI